MIAALIHTRTAVNVAKLATISTLHMAHAWNAQTQIALNATNIFALNARMALGFPTQVIATAARKTARSAALIVGVASNVKMDMDMILSRENVSPAL